MKKNVANEKNTKKVSRATLPKSNTIKRTSIESKPRGKKMVLANSDKITQKKSQPVKKTQPLRDSIKAITTKIEIEVKEKEPTNVTPVKDNKISNEIIELEKELQSLTNEAIQIKNRIQSSEKKNINILNDIELKDNHISYKTHKLNRLKRKNAELKEKLEELDNKRQEVSNSLPNDNEPSSSLLDNFLFRLIASSALFHEEEEHPLSNTIIEKLPVTSYTSSSDDTTKCQLCNFDLCKNDIVIEIPSCCHIFHKACLLNYFHKNNTCPSCKMEIKDF